MQISIRIPAIGDGDAIIVTLEKEENKLLFLIDGGRVRNATVVAKTLDEALTAAGKEAPDFILCTHYDDDHIGGLTPILRKYGKAIGRVWIHATSEKYDRNLLTERKPPVRQKSGIFPSEASRYLKAESGVEATAFNQVIKNLQQEIDLLELLDGLKIPVSEPIAGRFSIPDWPELTIVAPTVELYEQLFPATFKTEILIQSEMEGLIEDTAADKDIDIKKALDDLPKKGLTATNANSAILMLRIVDKKFLFAADSGIKSFEAIPNHKEVLADLYWLKVPHHGSFKNLNSKLIDLMRPKAAVISGEHHVSAQVVACFKGVKSDLFITSKQGDYFYQEMVTENGS
jgi:beta-lactamase superfamily II metal-dependent hydrolase